MTTISQFVGTIVVVEEYYLPAPMTRTWKSVLDSASAMIEENVSKYYCPLAMSALEDESKERRWKEMAQDVCNPLEIEKSTSIAAIETTSSISIPPLVLCNR